MDKKLELYVVSCYLDKKQEEEAIPSKYEVNIQAGAALTDQRTQSINDFDDFDESISERNLRYCECTAIFWVYKHINVDYVGIEHYRRRFKVSDEELKQYMEEEVDIVAIPCKLEDDNVMDQFIKNHYAYDWDLMIEAIERRSPDYLPIAEKYFCGNILFPFNMSIMKAELFKEYGDWMFPILDDVYQNSFEKTDKYQRRDIGFIAERLTGLFIFKKMIEGANVKKVLPNILKSKEWEPKDECSFNSADEVMEVCRKLYSLNKIQNMSVLINEAVFKYNIITKEIKTICDIIISAREERHNLECTLYEYLPLELRDNLDNLIEAYNTLENVIVSMNDTRNEQMCEMCKEYLAVSRFSEFVIINICKGKNIDENSIFEMLGVD